MIRKGQKRGDPRVLVVLVTFFKNYSLIMHVVDQIKHIHEMNIGHYVIISGQQTKNKKRPQNWTPRRPHTKVSRTGRERGCAKEPVLPGGG